VRVVAQFKRELFMQFVRGGILGVHRWCPCFQPPTHPPTNSEAAPRPSVCLSSNQLRVRAALHLGDTLPNETAAM